MISFNWYQILGTGTNIPFAWSKMSETGKIWCHSIGIRYLDLVEYDTVQLVLHVWKWLKLIPFNWYQIFGTYRIWYHSIGIRFLELVEYDTIQLVSHVWKWFDTIQLVSHVRIWLKLIPFNWYQISGICRIWYHSIGIRFLELVEYDTMQLVSDIWNM